LEGTDVVIVHEWTPPDLVAHIGRLRQTAGRFALLFHDTHHRGVSESASIEQLPLQDYDAVLAFGETLRLRYERLGWGRRVFTWHEAADTTVFHPLPPKGVQKDLVWIGNWGDGERARELDDFLIEPARQAKLDGTVHGVRYPTEALDSLAATDLAYQGWLPNAEAPESFAQHRMTVHVPRRPYVEALPGIPTIRVFEALACGIPLVSAPWRDEEGLFRPGQDFLTARDTAEMTRHLNAIRHDQDLARAIADSGLRRIRERHTCAHRVDELLAIVGTIAAHQRTASSGTASQGTASQVAAPRRTPE